MPTPRDDTARYPRELFNNAAAFSGAPFAPSYRPTLLNPLLEKQRELELQLFDLINEAAVRRDPSLQADLKLHAPEFGYVTRLAVAHYRWVFGEKAQLDWLLAEDKKRGIGRDSLILTVFGYMDEWDKTIRWLKQNEEYNENDHRHNAAAGEIVAQAIATRKSLYGAERFEKAWTAVKTN